MGLLSNIAPGSRPPLQARRHLALRYPSPQLSRLTASPRHAEPVHAAEAQEEEGDAQVAAARQLPTEEGRREPRLHLEAQEAQLGQA